MLLSVRLVLDGLLLAFGGTHLVLLSMCRMPWDTEAEGELVVGLSLEHEGVLFATAGPVWWATWTSSGARPYLSGCCHTTGARA